MYKYVYVIDNYLNFSAIRMTMVQIEDEIQN